MSSNEEENVAILVPLDDYAHHINQVVSVGTGSLRVLKRKLSLSTPYRIDLTSIENCKAVEYKSGLSVFHIGAGVLLIALILGVFTLIGVYWSRLEPGTRIQVGLLALAFAYGTRWAFMSKHHRLVFNLRDGSKLQWRSRSGDFKYRERAVEKVLEHVRNRGLAVTVK
jgi:hypothetical protein